MSRYKKRFYANLITLGSIVFTYIVLLLLRLIPAVSEWWSRTISRGEQIVNNRIFGWLPFSCFELFIILFALYIIGWLVLTIRHLVRFSLRGSSRYWLNFGIVVSLVLTVYMGSAGMEYNRRPVDIPLHTELISDTQEYKNVAAYFQTDFNECSEKLSFREDGSLILPYTNKELDQIMEVEFKKLNSDYYTQSTTKAKRMNIFGWLYRELQITGVAFGPTGEANVNQLATAAEYAFTTAHEIAHTKGIIREEDANLVAAYICLTSSDPYLRYSGYMCTIGSLGYLVRCTNVEQDYYDFTHGYTKQIAADSKYMNEYWKKHDMLGKISDWMNDLYLKLQGDKGTISYTDNIDITKDDKEYRVNSYSRYQALYMWLYLDN